MNFKSNQCFEQMYTKLKYEYDSLLEKNQNDLIKIRIRQKLLNEKIVEIERQREQQVKLLKEQINSLRDQILKQGLNKQLMDKKDTEYAQIKAELVRAQNINKKLQLQSKSESVKINQLSQRVNDCQLHITKLQRELSNASDLLNQKEAQLKELTVSKQNIANHYQIKLFNLREINKQQILQMDRQKDNNRQVRDKQLTQLNNSIQTMKEKLITTNNQLKISMQKVSGQQITLQIKDKKIKQQEDQINLMKTEYHQYKRQVQQCSNCQQFQLELELQKEMVKSVKMMLKFKEMELEKYKE